jgi:predicted Zn finger-like uncharacterized protein
MIIVCPSCSSRYKFDETKLGSRKSARTKCAKCGGSIEIENPAMGAFTLPPGSMPAVAPGAKAPPKGQDAHVASTTATPGPAPATDEKLRTKKAAVTPNVGEATSTGRDLFKAGILELPKDRRYSLAVLQGASTGQIFPISNVRRGGYRDRRP